jgi:ABC-2 type transport system permease protein
VNAWFHVLVSYGDEFETLGFTDLVDVRSSGGTRREVRLRNPEFDLTRAIRDVLHSYRLGGNLFNALQKPVELVAYVSADEHLPERLRDYKQGIIEQLEVRARQSGGLLSYRFVEPEAGNADVARQLADDWGFRPMIAALGDNREFYFYLTLSDEHQVVQLPTEAFNTDDFDPMLYAGLKRFASGFTRTVALAVPPVNQQMAQHHLGAPTFTNLEQAITRDYSIRLVDLDEGMIDPEVDILAVVAPQALEDRALFAIDQFLMRGGTVFIATSPFTVELSGGDMRLQDYNSGLQRWLASHGITIGSSLVLDPQNALFPTPVRRQAGGHEFRDVQMIDYPYFIDLRPPGLNPEHPITANLPQLTMGWTSPISVQAPAGVRITSLLRSSSEAWLSAERDIIPRQDASGRTPFMPEDETARGSHQLGVLLEGRFQSWFTGHKPPPATDEGPPVARGVIEHSPESARLILIASNDFMDDQMLKAALAAAGSQYLGPLELFMNTLEWALQDEALLGMRARGHFNRTLPPMDRQAQRNIEYLNYALAIGWLALLALIHWLRTLARRRYYQRTLAP